jgi:hypothetical protein
MANIKVEEAKAFDALIGGADPAPLQKIVTLLAGQGALKRGAVLGVATASGKAKLVNSASADGSQDAKYILAEDADTTAADINAPAYQAGMFNREYLVFGGTDTYAAHEEALRGVGIFLATEKYK